MSDEQDDRKETYLARVSHVQMGMAPRNLEEGLRMAELLARSTLIPTEYRGNSGNVLIAIQMGMEIGLPPMQALQSIAVINGKPTIYGDGLLAVVQSSPHFEWIDEPPVENGVARCTVKRKGWPNPVTRTFTMDDAKKAGLWNKTGPWQNYPDRMLRMRARAFALRDVFADVLRGIASAEEMLDVVSTEVTEVKPNPDTLMRNDLACTDEDYAEIVRMWDALNVVPAQRILQSKKYAGRAAALTQMLIDMGAPLAVPASIAAPIPVTKQAKKRLAKARDEGTAPLPPPAPPAPACEHGVLLDDPCEACIRANKELDQELSDAPVVVKPGETADEYAKRRLAEVQAEPDDDKNLPF